MHVDLNDENELWLRKLSMEYGKSVTWLVNKMLDDIRKNGKVRIVEAVLVELDELMPPEKGES